MLPYPSLQIQRRLAKVLEHPKGFSIAVVGLGIIGEAISRHLHNQGAHLSLFDHNSNFSASWCNELNLTPTLGHFTDDILCHFDAIAISPGVNPHLPMIDNAVQVGVPLFGELELVTDLPTTVIAVGGTNGKSTTTVLLGELLQAAGKNVFIGGNLGTPILSLLKNEESLPMDVAVLELSSFQLETAYSFAPDVSILLNISPDHLDRYADFSQYCHAKNRMLSNMNGNGIAILNRDNAHVRKLATKLNPNLDIRWFSEETRQVNEKSNTADDPFVLYGDNLLQFHGCSSALSGIKLNNPHLLGAHNNANAAAAFMALDAVLEGTLSSNTLKDVTACYEQFLGLPHRLEFLGEHQGVRWLNDSKATNDMSAAVSVEAVESPILLIAGGKEKGTGYQKLTTAAAGKVEHIFAFGEASSALAHAFDGISTVHITFDLTEATQQAVIFAKSGHTILLAPACSSYDQFKNYMERGQCFRDIAHRIIADGKGISQ